MDIFITVWEVQCGYLCVVHVSQHAVHSFHIYLMSRPLFCFDRYNYDDVGFLNFQLFVVMAIVCLIDMWTSLLPNEQCDYALHVTTEIYVSMFILYYTETAQIRVYMWRRYEHSPTLCSSRHIK